MEQGRHAFSDTQKKELERIQSIMNMGKSGQPHQNRKLNLLFLIRYEVIGAQRKAQESYAISSPSDDHVGVSGSSSSLSTCSCTLYGGDAHCKIEALDQFGREQHTKCEQ